jgi:hypothetical protein
MKTLEQLRNHPAVHEIILESDHGRRTYVINLKRGFATDNGGGQQSGTESTLAGVAAFLKTVAAMPAEKETATDRYEAYLAANIKLRRMETVTPDVAATPALIERIKAAAALALANVDAMERQGRSSYAAAYKLEQAEMHHALAVNCGRRMTLIAAWIDCGTAAVKAGLPRPPFPFHALDRINS